MFRHVEFGPDFALLDSDDNYGSSDAADAVGQLSLDENREVCLLSQSTPARRF